MNGIIPRIPDQIKRRVLSVVPKPVWRTVRPIVHGETTIQRRLHSARLARLKLSAARFGLSELRPVIFDGEGFLGQTVTEYRAADFLAHHCSLVADVLDEVGIRYAVLDAQSQKPRILVVPADQRGEVLRALSSRLAGTGTYLGTVRRGHVTAPVLITTSAGDVAADVVRVFQVRVSPSGTFLGGPEVGCDIEFWHEALPGTFDAPNESVAPGWLVAPRANRWVTALAPSHFDTEQKPVDGQLRPVLAGSSRTHPFDQIEPIDVVYTWVDGSDPAWKERMHRALADARATTTLHPTATNESRFVSRDELKYSLRSLDMYASWVRRVFLVTDGQVPDWLDVNHPKLTIVKHSELFGENGTLPTFNSHAIESQLHRIPGLSEYYLYLNDDVFIGRPISPAHFFHGNGIAKFFLSDQQVPLGDPLDDDLPVVSAAKNNRRLLFDRFGRAWSQKVQHVPHAQRRSTVEQMEREFAEDFKRTASSQFRHRDDISVAASMQHYYGYATGTSMPAKIRYFYADIACADTEFRLKVLLKKRNHDVFCLNDHDSAEISVEEQTRIMQDFLRNYYPVPSSFER